MRSMQTVARRCFTRHGVATRQRCWPFLAQAKKPETARDCRHPQRARKGMHQRLHWPCRSRWPRGQVHRPAQGPLWRPHRRPLRRLLRRPLWLHLLRLLCRRRSFLLQQARRKPLRRIARGARGAGGGRGARGARGERGGRGARGARGALPGRRTPSTRLICTASLRSCTPRRGEVRR